MSQYSTPLAQSSTHTNRFYVHVPECKESGLELLYIYSPVHHHPTHLGMPGNEDVPLLQTPTYDT